jgi:hypothetical protein
MVVLYKENTAVLLHFELMVMSLCYASQTSDFLGDISDPASVSSSVSSSQHMSSACSVLSRMEHGA